MGETEGVDDEIWEVEVGQARATWLGSPHLKQRRFRDIAGWGVRRRSDWRSWVVMEGPGVCRGGVEEIVAKRSRIAWMGSTMNLIGMGSFSSRARVVMSRTCLDMTAMAVCFGIRYWSVRVARRMRLSVALGMLRESVGTASLIWNRQASVNGRGGCLYLKAA